ncbi:hypothetical protein [Sphingomonas sp. CFBP 8760]|uniref:hypothetical protein n=1 Tax=Sphingomonas sp. CFBP 8760 TaxID=2775282 RepID=UPI001785EDE2|nr:hypothetical protein [Sphingomonas sp. CFBP 8760]MBD8548304.1 hypothetical protein [Sphingomonas sp. CFBP 8760]
MLKRRRKRIAAHAGGAVERLAEIETSIRNLDDEDVLDLADIFRDMPHTALTEIVHEQMTKRGISL